MSSDDGSHTRRLPTSSPVVGAVRLGLLCAPDPFFFLSFFLITKSPPCIFSKITGRQPCCFSSLFVTRASSSALLSGRFPSASSDFRLKPYFQVSDSPDKRILLDLARFVSSCQESVILASRIESSSLTICVASHLQAMSRCPPSRPKSSEC